MSTPEANSLDEISCVETPKTNENESQAISFGANKDLTGLPDEVLSIRSLFIEGLPAGIISRVQTSLADFLSYDRYRQKGFEALERRLANLGKEELLAKPFILEFIDLNTQPSPKDESFLEEVIGTDQDIDLSQLEKSVHRHFLMTQQILEGYVHAATQNIPITVQAEAMDSFIKVLEEIKEDEVISMTTGHGWRNHIRAGYSTQIYLPSLIELLDTQDRKALLLTSCTAPDYQTPQTRHMGIFRPVGTALGSIRVTPCIYAPPVSNGN